MIKTLLIKDSLKIKKSNFLKHYESPVNTEG